MKIRSLTLIIAVIALLATPAMAGTIINFDGLPTTQPLAVLCHHGARSQMIVDFLRDAGFDNAVNLEGSIEAWACEMIDATLSIA